MNFTNINKDMILDEWFKIYAQAYMPRLAPLTQKSYTGIYNNHIKAKLGQIKLAEINSVKLNIWAASLAGSAKTIKNIVGVLLAILHPAQSNQLITGDVNIITPKLTASKIKALTLEESRRLIKACYPPINQFDIIILTALSTGMRLGEILALTWEQINFTDETININAQVIRVSREYKRTPPKYNSVRTIPISKELQKTLLMQKLINHNKDKVFSTNKGEYINQNRVRAEFKARLEAAGLPHDIRFHDLRHTFATQMLQSGADIKTVSAMLGHTSEAFTLKQYAHTDNSAMREAMRNYQARMSFAV